MNIRFRYSAMLRMAVAATIISVCSLWTAAQTAPTQHFELKLRDFTELKVVDGINVDYVCSADSAGYAVFDALPELAPKIMFEPSGDRLTIQLLNDEGPLHNLPTIKVYSRYLQSVENDGDSLVRALSVAPIPKFKAKLVGNGRLSVRDVDANEVKATLLTGNGTITITGRCTEAILQATSTGTITADQLVATEVKCRLAGTSTIGCAPTEKLQVRGMAGKVLYKGKPAINKSFALGVKVEPF